MDYFFLFLPLLMVAAIAPFEASFPRFASLFKLSHFFTLIAFGLMGIALSVLLPLTVQNSLIGLVAPFQVLSVPQLPIPNWLGFILCFLLIDFANYCLHRLSHWLPALWRLHKIHHTDRNVQAATGLLHHPVELFLGYLVMVPFFVVLGVPVLVIIAYSVTNQIHGIFSHSNICYPAKLNAYLKYLIFMPDVHRIHHSVDMSEGDSNFGEIFPFWDMVFGTYKNASLSMTGSFEMGLPNQEQATIFSVISLLALPAYGATRNSVAGTESEKPFQPEVSKPQSSNF